VLVEPRRVQRHRRAGEQRLATAAAFARLAEPRGGSRLAASQDGQTTCSGSDIALLLEDPNASAQDRFE
jgi:hypothetical protein